MIESSGSSRPQAVPGIRLGTAAAGIKHPNRPDLLVIEADPGSACAAVFTRNAFCAAPVLVARDHLADQPRWLLVNSGNANAGTGVRGVEDARATCSILAGLAGGEPRQVLPFSTGVIGEYLPLEKIAEALPGALQALNEDGWLRAAEAIMTTDTRPKLASRSFTVAGRTLVMTGIAKGAGMIHPDMATMLAFVATDVAIEADSLQYALKSAADRTFNCITVDGDTSTNDSCVLLASGASGSPVLNTDHEEFSSFAEALESVCAELAEAIVRDGEGATKLIRIMVHEAETASEAHRVAKTIAHSPLVKTAFFASDANWGRILAAVGRAGVENLAIERVSIWLDEVLIVQGGQRASSYTEAAGAAVMARNDITVRVSLARGTATETVLTCDLSFDYVRINAEYRT